MGDGRAAVFLDRDGTVIHDRGYLGRPEGVELVPGAAAAIRRLNRAGLPVLLITNQSGIGRGMYTEEDFRDVQRRLSDLLDRQGARLDGVYLCPHSPEHEPACECRKPAAGLFRRAASEHDVELAASWFVGDRARDVLPALECGGHGIIVGADAGESVPPGIGREPSLAAAVERILDGLGS